MNTTRSGIGRYKRQTSPSGKAQISAESRAKMDTAHALCQQRAAPTKKAAQAVDAYRNENAGLSAAAVEVQA